MDDKSFNIRVPKKWARTGLVVLITAVLVAPLTALAAHQFTDVPDSNIFHDDIAWMADAGVTKGCNPPANDQFCPEDVLSRQQMSAFMHRFAQYLGAEDGTPAQADNAQQLDGEDAAAYRSVTAADLDGSFGGSSVVSETETNSVGITAPADGILVVSGSAFVNNTTGGAALLGLRPSVDGTLLQGAAGNASFISLPASGTTTLAYTVAFAVTAGAHTVNQTASVVDNVGAPTTGSFFFNANQLTVEWHPEGTISLASTADSGGDFDG